MSADPGIEVFIDTTEGDKVLDEFSDRGKQAVNAQIMGMRRATEMSILTLQAFGVVIDQTLRAQIRVVQVGIETALQVNAAIAAGTFGASTLFTIGIAAVQIFVLVRLISAIENARTEEAAQLQATITLLYMTESYTR